MLKPFFRLYEQMLKDKPGEGYIRRGLMDEIDPGSVLVCIRGERGVGKTRFLLDYAEEKCRGRKCLYASLNYFYFSVHSLYSFAAKFVLEESGEVLLLDQIYKYPSWAEELSKIHRDFKNLRILFTTSSVMNGRDFELLGEELKVYELKGLSLREYINLRTGEELPALTLQQVTEGHKEWTSRIRQSVSPLHFIKSYVYGGGYYPNAGRISKSGASLSDEELVKHLNMLLEVDVVYIRQIGPGYLPKLRRLLYTIANDAENPKQNISRLSDSLGISRATVMNYIHYLSDAGLVRPLYKSEEAERTKKPESLYIGNPNILSALTLETPDPKMCKVSFLLSHLSGAGVRVTLPGNVGKGITGFLAEGKTTLLLEDSELRRPEAPDTYLLSDSVGTSEDATVPLWLFGFLY